MGGASNHAKEKEGKAAMKKLVAKMTGGKAGLALAMTASFVFVCALLYSTLSAGFVWEDKLLATHPLYLRSGLGWPVILNPVLLDPSWMWRPVAMVAVALQLNVKSGPLPWHGVQLGLWLALSAISGVVALSFLRSKTPPASHRFMAAMVAMACAMLTANSFVGQPAWQIVGIFEIMAGLMLAWGLWASSRASSDMLKAFWVVTGFALATLCNEAAWAAAIPLAAWISQRGDSPSCRRAAWGGMAVWTGVWLAGRTVIFGGPFGRDWLGGAQWFDIVSESVARVAALVGLGAPKWPGAALVITEQHVSWSLWIPCVIALAVLCWGSARRRGWAALGWSLVAAAIAMCFCKPLSYGGESAASSRLAILAPWLVVLWAWMLVDLRLFLSESLAGLRAPQWSAGPSRASVVVFVMALAWLGSQAAIGSAWRLAYQSDLALWSAAWESDQSNAAAASNLMLSFQKSHRSARALEVGEAFWSSVSNRSKWSRSELVAMANYAALLNDVADSPSASKAMVTLTRALPQSGQHPLVAINYNVAASKEGKTDEVIAAANYALASYGKTWTDARWAATLWAQKSKAQLSRGDKDGARESFAKALELEGLADPKGRMGPAQAPKAAVSGSAVKQGSQIEGSTKPSSSPDKAESYFAPFDPTRVERRPDKPVARPREMGEKASEPTK
jgi:tetratricopeptide (TPR) repeat protein